ncbi:MAG TPA: carboxypeptidase regulatory-like domain-containing protein, partial [Bacteroidales bacterium]|nr:carboxypeptidase regulatory-like domain-containing protein [Bacteroidales bacterium]
GTLLEYVFTSTGGYSALTWDVTTQASCEYGDVNANVLPATFTNGSVTVVPDPAITSDPANVTLEEGQNASFTVTASNATGYQWEVSTDNGNTWNSVGNTLPYIGANSATLQIISTPVGFNQYQYRCIASGMCQPAATSQAALLTVTPIITTTIGTHSFCADEIIVPVNVEHFYGVAGVSLTMGYNSVVLQYAGVHSSHPALASGTLFDNSILGKVFISWFSITPVNIGDDLLLELAFTSNNPGASSLVWDTINTGNCEYNNIASGIISSVFVDGMVNVLPTPAKFQVTGGGEYCAGGMGVMLGLSGSQNGVTYELMLDGIHVMYMNGTGSAISFGYQTGAGTYTVHAVTVSSGCDMHMTGSKTVTINALPVANAGADQIMLLGTGASLDGSATGGTPGYTYLWTPGNLATEDANVNPAVTTVYTLLVTDSKGCTDTDDATVTVYMNTVKGYVTYNNNQNTPMSGVTVYMEDDNGGSKTVRTDVTDANGYYEFPAVANGTYNLWATHNGAWGGVNSTDALVIMEHFIKLHLITDPLKLEAADVDASTYVNTTDAFQAASRFAQIISAFNAGDWVFETAQVTLNLDDYVSVNLEGMCTGDANGSYIPGLKAASSVSLSQQGTLNISGKKEIEIPFSVTEPQQVGAISLELLLPEGMQVSSVMAGKEIALFRQEGQVLNISWYNTTALDLEAGQTLFSIRAMVNGDLNGAISLVDGELADATAQPIPGASIVAPKLSKLSSSMELSNYPNPFSSRTQISYSLPEAGNVVIRVFNLLGEEVAELVNASAEAGDHTVSFNGSSLQPGLYHYRMDVNGASVTRTMVRIR